MQLASPPPLPSPLPPISPQVAIAFPQRGSDRGSYNHKGGRVAVTLGGRGGGVCHAEGSAPMLDRDVTCGGREPLDPARDVGWGRSGVRRHSLFRSRSRPRSASPPPSFSLARSSPSLSSSLSPSPTRSLSPLPPRHRPWRGAARPAPRQHKHFPSPFHRPQHHWR